ncbi:MAG: cryptochrome/photolyase family protein [Candidatus Caenarcaniphilales bacterium]|jgi:deoxyribodipyrimidine photolyase-related protein|nr:cryptochrome/photolyase family protein [Candidatus Caenarcaniphilales bacterium]
MIIAKPNTLRLILGDQLNISHSWYQEQDQSNIFYVLMEIKPESEYVTHHIQKIIGFFLAMRDFQESLKQKKLNVIYYKINDDNNLQDFTANLNHLIHELNVQKFEMQEPDEYRLEQYFKDFTSSLKIEYQTFSTEHFFTERYELKNLFGDKDHYLMESFYRKMRQKHNVLMDKNKPEGDKWNFDHDNRKSLPKNHQASLQLIFDNDFDDVLNDINQADLQYFGNSENFNWPINYMQSKLALDYFCNNHLQTFGLYQDAMSIDDEFISHSKLSFSLNLKILSPQEVINAAIQAYRNNTEISLAQVEGFIRQILGWREFMRSFYWCKMPNFAKTNFFDHSSKLPEFYWTAKTKMNCLRHCIKSSLDNAYAHHIQRLMVTGNYALLLGVDPNQVDNWYLGVYIDAIEWVEITNTRGMSQWADGGGLATKPYISSANYINKMSNYCKNCFYDHKEKLTDNACPFNFLYWAFLIKHQNLLKSNLRMSMMYKLLEKFTEEEKTEILQKANDYRPE